VADGRSTSERLIERLIARAEREPAIALAERATGDALAAKVGGDAAFAWEVVVLRALIAEPPDGDAVREVYGALVDRYRDTPARMAALRPLGDEIKRLEQTGALASTLVARSERKKR
jgi:hypothetical protein